MTGAPFRPAQAGSIRKLSDTRQETTGKRIALERTTDCARDIVAAPMAATTPMRRRVLPRMVMSFRGVVWCRGVGGAGGAVGERATVRARVGSVAPIT